MNIETVPDNILKIRSANTDLCTYAFEFEVLTFHTIRNFDASQHIDVLKFKFHDMSFGKFVQGNFSKLHVFQVWEQHRNWILYF